MRKSRQQMLNMQAQLEHMAIRIETISKLKFNNNRVDTIGTEFNPTFQDLDGQQNCNKYKWKHKGVDGLTDYLPSWLVEYMLYARGSLCGFILGGVLYVLPYAQNKGINTYGLPNAVQPITFNGAMPGGRNTPFGKELSINNFGDPNSKATACILYDRIPVWSANSSPVSRAVLNKCLVDYQGEIMGRVKNQLKTLIKKLSFGLIAKSKKTKWQTIFVKHTERTTHLLLQYVGHKLTIETLRTLCKAI